jgi:hypothetical protein
MVHGFFHIFHKEVLYGAGGALVLPSGHRFTCNRRGTCAAGLARHVLWLELVAASGLRVLCHSIRRL